MTPKPLTPLIAVRIALRTVAAVALAARLTVNVAGVGRRGRGDDLERLVRAAVGDGKRVAAGNCRGVVGDNRRVDELIGLRGRAVVQREGGMGRMAGDHLDAQLFAGLKLWLEST